RAHAEEFEAERVALADVGTASRVIARDQLSTEIGSNAYHGGIAIDAGGGGDPGRGVGARGGRAPRARARRPPGGRAPPPRRPADGRFVVETKRGAILAKDVLVATNGYTDGVAPTLRRRIIPIGSYIIATEPLSEALAKELSPTGRAYFDTRNFLSYWHVTAD